MQVYNLLLRPVLNMECPGVVQNLQNSTGFIILLQVFLK